MGFKIAIECGPVRELIAALGELMFQVPARLANLPRTK
jgi:hypothetical protein